MSVGNIIAPVREYTKNGINLYEKMVLSNLRDSFSTDREQSLC